MNLDASQPANAARPARSGAPASSGAAGSGRVMLLRSAGALLVLLLLLASWQLGSVPSRELRVLAAEMALHEDPFVDLDAIAEPPAGLHWQPLDQRELAGWRGPYWLRWQLQMPEPAGEPLGLRLSLRAASRIWWNGHPLADNGRVGRSADEERPGRIDQLLALPAASSAVDAHELIVLASSQHQRFGFRSADAGVGLAPFGALYRGALLPWLVVALALGMLALAWASLLLMQRGRGRGHQTFLLLALGAVVLLMPLVEAWRPLLGYAYPWHGVRLYLLLALHLAAALLLPAYLGQRFRVLLPWPAWVGAVVLLVLLVVLLPGFDSRGAALLMFSLLASTALLLAARDEMAERLPVLALLAAGLLALLWNPRAFLDGQYVLLMAVLLAFLLLRQSQRLLVIDLELVRLRAERDRLGLQLLRRGMQPHWLMNTLTSLQELIEQAPERASRMVELLAAQFDLLRDSSERPLLSLAEELALCRSHLDTVSLALQKPIGIDIDADADALELKLPPGVLHAQVENALTHAGAAACALRPFRLRARRQGALWVLELRAARGRSGRQGQGSGTRYIEASLAAASPAGWRFVQTADGDDWLGRIELTCAS